MNIAHKHDWNITPTEAIALQRQLVNESIYDRPIDIEAVRYVAGVDVSVKPDTNGIAMSQAAIAVLSFPDLTPVETALAVMPTPFPYISGLLSFREGPVLEEAFKSLTIEPDVFIFDGMGRAHPRRMGIATHLGIWLQKPTIGCGKTLLIGKFQEPPNERGAYSEMTDRGEIIGAALRTRVGTKPVFISPGHLADLETSVEMVMRCTTKYRLPETTRAAHNAAGKFANL